VYVHMHECLPVLYEPSLLSKESLLWFKPVLVLCIRVLLKARVVGVCVCVYGGVWWGVCLFVCLLVCVWGCVFAWCVSSAMQLTWFPFCRRSRAPLSPAQSNLSGGPDLLRRLLRHMCDGGLRSHRQDA